MPAPCLDLGGSFSTHEHLRQCWRTKQTAVEVETQSCCGALRRRIPANLLLNGACYPGYRVYPPSIDHHVGTGVEEASGRGGEGGPPQ